MLRRGTTGMFFAASVAAHVVLAAALWLAWDPPAALSRRARPVTLEMFKEKPKTLPPKIAARPDVAPAAKDTTQAVAPPRRKVWKRALSPITGASTDGLKPVVSVAGSGEGPIVAASTPSGLLAAPEPVRLTPGVAAAPKRRSAKDWGAVARQMRSAIRKNLHYPVSARRQGKEGVVVVKFRVQAGGKAHPVRIHRSAGTVLDRAAVRAVRASQPLPAYPDWVEVPLTFRLDD